MKKLVLLLGAILLVTQGVYAADKFGSVDLGKVMQQYSKSKEATKWAQEQEKSIQDFIADARKKYNAAATDELRSEIFSVIEDLEIKKITFKILQNKNHYLK